MSVFGDTLRKLRKENGLTQNQLADYLGLAFSTISMYERGDREPDFETTEAIADYFNVTIDFLYGKSKMLNNNIAVITEEDKELLNISNGLTPDNRNKLIDYGKLLLNSQK